MEPAPARPDAPIRPDDPGLADDPASLADDPALLEDDASETVVVERSAPSTADPTWVLVTDDGGRHALDASVVVLGRRPAGEEPGVQYLAVPDTSRTLSKQHACLTRDGDSWTVTDLSSTNGVFVERDGVERRLEPGETVAVTGRIVLGTVGAALEREESR